MNRQKDLDECRRNFMEATGRVIAKKRKRKNITQEELGEALNVSGTTIGRYEKGTIDIPSSSLPLIGGVCDFHMRDYVYEWEDINVENMIREALKTKTDTPDETEIDYIVQACTSKEEEEILSLGLSAKYVTDIVYRNELYTIMIEHHIDNKLDEQARNRILNYYLKICELKRKSEQGDLTGSEEENK